MQKVAGIGGLFFRPEDPGRLAKWFETHLGISPVPTSCRQQRWRVADLRAMVAQLRAARSGAQPRRTVGARGARMSQQRLTSLITLVFGVVLATTGVAFAEAPAYDPATFHADGRLLDADVRFCGAEVAVVYGSETSTVTLPDSTQERRCLVWTDTWLRRDGKWQIIAVQDARIDCPAP
jgi:hypothetical protein